MTNSNAPTFMRIEVSRETHAVLDGTEATTREERSIEFTDDDRDLWEVLDRLLRFDDAEPNTTASPSPGESRAKQAEGNSPKVNDQSHPPLNIAPLPPIKNPVLRANCRNDLRLFCLSYLPQRFGHRWTNHGMHLLNNLERAVLANKTHHVITKTDADRGGGTTALIIAAALWSMLYGHRKCTLVLGPHNDYAEMVINAIRDELETNPYLLADFPEVCVCFQAIQGIRQRAAALHVNGVPTLVDFGKSHLVAPRISGSPASEKVIKAVGVSEHWAGDYRFALPSGGFVKPDLILVDEPLDATGRESKAFCKKVTKGIRHAVDRTLDCDGSCVIVDRVW